MRFSIRPGKVTCAGIVVIFMVLPNSIWKGPDAKVAPVPKPKIEANAKKTSRLTPAALEIPESAALNIRDTTRGSTAAPVCRPVRFDRFPFRRPSPRP